MVFVVLELRALVSQMELPVLDLIAKVPTTLMGLPQLELFESMLIQLMVWMEQVPIQY